jgi:molybdate transport system substrate-binding protein
MRTRTPLLAIAFAVSALAGSLTAVHPAQAQPETLTIVAANSLRDAFRKVLPLYEAQYPETNLRIIYGPSQTLRSQIEQGAPVEVFLPSLADEIDQLQKKGLIVEGSKRIYAGTALVLITGAALPASVTSIQDLHNVSVRRLAIGDPKTSSVGKVATQFLKSSQLEPKLKSQYVFGEHSRAVLDLVANGEADVGIVYRTDAALSKKVRILDTTPPESHAPVYYGVALPWTAKNISGATDFVQFLLTPQVQALLQQYGFDRVSSDVGVAHTQEEQR